MNTRRAAIGLADWLQAMHRLGRRDEASAAEVARLLGLDDTTASTVVERPTPPMLNPPQLPAAPPPPPPISTPPPPDPHASPAQWRGGALSLQALPTATPLSAPPAFGSAPLAAAGPPVAAPLPSLLDPATTRALLVALASALAPSGDVDVEHLALWLVRGRVLRRLPERWRRTLRCGVQVLVHAAPGMEPFEHDARQLVGALRRLLPPKQVASGHWLGGDDLACWMDGAPRATRWQPPAAGGVLLLLTDFSHGGWLPLARAVTAQGVLMRTLVPRPPAEWPAAARQHLQPLHWERTLTVAALRPGAAPAAAPLAVEDREQRLLDLAALASLAVRVDPPLLRRLRLRLPGADAGIEAALWASEWVESKGVEGFVLDGVALPRLRERLLATPGALTMAWQETQAAHARWPASLRLEERLTWLGLGGGDVDWDSEWEPVLAAIAQGDDRAKEVARWAVRAVPRLPAAARGCDPARAVLLAAALRIGGAARTLAGNMPGAAYKWLMQAPAATSEWAVHGAGTALLLRPRTPVDPPERVLRLPATRPPLVELAWVQDDVPQRMLCPVQAGQALPLPAGADDVVLRTLGGDGWRVLAAGAGPAADERWRDWQVLMLGRGQLIAMGVLVSPEHVLTVNPMRLGSRGTKEPQAIDEIHIGAVRFRLIEVAVDDLEDPDTGLMLVTLPGQVASLPAEITEAMPAEDGSPVHVTAWHDGPGAYLDSYRAHAIEPGRLRLDGGGRRPSAGAALVVGGQLAGLAQADREHVADGAAIRRFLAWGMLPKTEWPVVTVELSRAEDMFGSSGVGALLVSLNLRPSRSPADPLAEAALIVLPMAPNGQGRAQELSVALRGWTDLQFGIVVAGRASAQLTFFDRLERHDLSDPNIRTVLHEAVRGPSRRRRQAPAPERVPFDLRELARGTGFTRSETMALAQQRNVLEELVAHWVRVDNRPSARQALALAIQENLGTGPWLRRLADPAPLPPLAMGVVPVVLARMALAKAFYPLPSWRSVELRRPMETAEQIHDALALRAAEDIGAEPRETARALTSLRAPYFVLLMNPLPPAAVLQKARKLLPGARFIGLVQPGQAPKGYERLDLELSEGGLPMVMQFYKPLAELIDPRPVNGRSRVSPKRSK